MCAHPWRRVTRTPESRSHYSSHGDLETEIQPDMAASTRGEQNISILSPIEQLSDPLDITEIEIRCSVVTVE